MGERLGSLFVPLSQEGRSETPLSIEGKERRMLKRGHTAFIRVLGQPTIWSFGLFLTEWAYRSCQSQVYFLPTSLPVLFIPICPIYDPCSAPFSDLPFHFVHTCNNTLHLVSVLVCVSATKLSCHTQRSSSLHFQMPSLCLAC